MASATRRAVVVGAGVAGLSTARELGSRGWKVALVAEHEPLHPLTTSQGAGGLWMPFHVEPAAATARWAAETLHTFLREKEEGRERAKFIRTLPVVLMKKDKALAEETPPEWTKIPELGFKVHASDVMAKHQEVRLPPGYGAWYFHAPVIHAEPYLSSMVDELRDKGVLTEFRRRFPSLRDAYKYGTELLDGDVHAVVNCTGMGANHICSEDQGSM